MAKEKSITHRTRCNDIFMSIKPEHMHNIATGVKNHEYRRYLLPSSVRRIWFYKSSPVSLMVKSLVKSQRTAVLVMRTSMRGKSLEIRL